MVRVEEDDGTIDRRVRDGARRDRRPRDGDRPTMWVRARRRRRRFLERYEQRRAERLAGRHHPLKRPIRVTSGVVLILTGVAIGWLPGPGFVIFAIPGALLVASEWRRAALVMDRVEDETIPYLRRLHAKLRGGPKQEWIDEDPELWGLWADRRLDAAPDTGERRRLSDLEPELESDPDDDVRSA
ncbi:MAG: hypothetical protein JWL76_1666 [Thermoleophilia bacterium]|nr:hypothetical protein [Thermoleophilia bacterium]